MKPLLYSILPRPPHASRDGLAIRNFYLLRALAAEFRVRALVLRPPHLASRPEDYPPDVDVEEFAQRRRTLRRATAVAASLLSGEAYSPLLYRSRRLARRLEEAVDQERPAWIVAHSYHVGPFALGRGRPAWIDFHNLDSQIWSRMGETAASRLVRLFARFQARRVATFERQLLAAANGVSCVSAEDAQALHALAPTVEPCLVPNGVDLDRYTFRAEPAADKMVFFVGDLTWPPNAEGIRWFRESVWPRVARLQPDARVEILGRGVPADLRRASEPRFRLLGEGDDTRPYWKRAAVAIVPLRAAGGTRLKILEAAACGVPVVATTVGAEGLGFRPGTEIVLRDDPSEFADAVVHLLAEPEARHRQAAAARAGVEKKYEWDRIGERLLRELRAATERA